MTNASWDFNQTSTTKKNDFTKFPEGITRIRIVDTAPLMRWTHWMPKHSRALNCPGKGCPICEIRKQQKANGEPYSYGVARKFAITVLNRETKKVEILEQGVTFFQEVKDIMDDLASKGKTLMDVDLRVKRRGTNQTDTSYRIDVDEEYPLTEDDLKLLEERPNIENFVKPHDVEKILLLIQGSTWEEVFYNNDSESDDTEEQIDLK